MEVATDVKIRWGVRDDIPSILEIEQLSFADPWNETDLRTTLKIKNVIMLVALVGDELVGYVVYALNNHSIEVINLAVHPCITRRGVGSVLVNTLCGKLTPEKRNRLKVAVRERNLDAQLFFKSMGFRAVNVVHGAFGEQSDEDAYLMTYKVREEALA